MAQNVHFEIFSRRGSKGGWNLVDVRQGREEAIAFAQELMSESVTGVKVVKETYNEETGDYLSLKIFEDGHNKVKLPPAQDDVPHALPCFKPDDLYSYHSRKTIARLIPEFLSRNKVTVTELGHRADLLEKLEATGTLLQHAIQKIAVAQAATSTVPVQQIMKSLYELTNKAFHRVYRDVRKERFPVAKRGEFGVLAAKLASQSDGRYLFNAALAAYLKDAPGWDEKVFRLIALMDEAGEDGPGAQLLLSSVDTIIAELLGGSAALHELIGAKENFGAAVASLVTLFLGQEPDPEEAGMGLISLTKRFAADQLPDSRGAIASRITKEFRSNKRLCPESLELEFKVLRRIANAVVTGVGKYLSHDDLVAAFVLRSKRLVTHETLGEYLAGNLMPDVKLERLLFVEENIIGAENKRVLASFVFPIVQGAAFEEYFKSSRTPVIQRLQRLAALGTRLRHSGFQETQRCEMADILDRIACSVEAGSKLFESVEAKECSYVEKANMLLRLFAAECFTEPMLSGRARELMLGYLSRPGFHSGYVAQTAQQGKQTTDDAVAELMGMLEKIGITKETGLNSIAA
jgi:hypothetical protein